MNFTKISAALHALADAILEGADTEAPPKRGRGKGAAAATPDLPPETSVTGAGQPTTPEVPPEDPARPKLTKEQLNAMVLKVAAKNRDAAVGVLNTYGHTNTIKLPEEHWQAVYDALEEELAKIDAAEVKVQQASLV